MVKACFVLINLIIAQPQVSRTQTVTNTTLTPVHTQSHGFDVKETTDDEDTISHHPTPNELIIFEIVITM